MPAPLRVEQRLTALEARMTALEQLPARMDRLATEMVELRSEMRDEFAAVRGELAARIEDSRRETRVLHEDVIGRIAVLGEGLTAHGQALTALSAETRTMTEMFDTVSSRLAAIENRLPVARRRKRAD